MPIYAVRWPDFTLSLVEAVNRKDLYWKLDKISDPMSVNFKEMENPLYLNLRCSRKPEVDDEKEKKPDPATLVVKIMQKLMNADTFTDLCVVINCNNQLPQSDISQ